MAKKAIVTPIQSKSHKVIRVLRPGSNRTVPLFEKRSRAAEESDEDWEKYCAEIDDWSSVEVESAMVTRSEYIQYALELDRRSAEFAKKLKDDGSDKKGMTYLEVESVFGDLYEEVFKRCVKSVKGIMFQDDVSGEEIDSSSLSQEQLLDLIRQVGKLMEVALACLRANRVSEDQKKA